MFFKSNLFNMSLVAPNAFFVWNYALEKTSVFGFQFQNNKSGLAKYHSPNYGSFLSGFLLDENSDKLRPCHSNYSQQVAHQAKTNCAADIRTTSSVISYRIVLVKKEPNNTKLCLFQSSGCFTRFHQTKKKKLLDAVIVCSNRSKYLFIGCYAKPRILIVLQKRPAVKLNWASPKRKSHWTAEVEICKKYDKMKPVFVIGPVM